MNRCIGPLDKRVLPDIDMDSFDVMMDASANVYMMRDASMMIDDTGMIDGNGST